MKRTVYKAECLTNLHVGSGEVNYNVIDNEVERDAITKIPVIHASGVKGALRDVTDEALQTAIFGAPSGAETSSEGTHKFFDAQMIARPMRVYESKTRASIPVVSIDSVNRFFYLMKAFGLKDYGFSEITLPDFGGNIFLTNCRENISVEGEKTGKLTGDTLSQLEAIKDIIGDEFALVGKYDEFPLPVVARNCLENGISKNLWYEEVVPHGSIFYFMVIAPADDKLVIPEIVQFGGNKSIGCGYTKVTQIFSEIVE